MRRPQVLAAVLLAAACTSPDSHPPADDLPAVSFDTASVLLGTGADTVAITVELATTPRQQVHGLMERDHLPERHGMLFVYDGAQPPGSTFYMFRTRIPLDIAFIGDDGRIANIRAMEPCEYPNPRVCPRYAADVPFVMALEVNRGFFERHGLGVGDRVVLR